MIRRIKSKVIALIYRAGSLFAKCVQFGISEKVPENIAYKIRLVNGFCFLAMVLLAIFAIVDFIRQSYIEVASDLLSIIPFSFPLILNKMGFLEYARVIFVAVCNGLILVTMWGLGSIDPFLNLLPIALAVVCGIFDWENEKKKMLSVYFLTLICFLVGSFFSKQGYFIDLENHPHIKYFVLGFSSIATTWLILYFNSNVGLYMKQMMIQFANREREIKAIAQVGKFAAIGQLAGGIAHEINNPVAIIRGKAQMILEHQKKLGQLDVFVERHLTAIIQTTHRISQITHGMLSLSRADSAEKTRFDVKMAIQDTISMCHDSMAKHGIKIVNNVKSMDGELISLGSKGHFQQALMNLFTNARDALLEQPQQKEPWIRVEATLLPKGIAIDISDNGPGVPAAIAERIMDPFFTTKEVGKGTGLGLSLSKTLVEAQGGQLILVNLKSPTVFRLVVENADVLKIAA